jgi:hypothetical protein
MNSNESFDRTASHMAGEYVSNTESVAYINKDDGLVCAKCFNPLYTHPAKTLTDEDIARVVHELNQKARTPDRWVTAMQIGAETIIQLRDELAILRKAQEK